MDYRVDMIVDNRHKSRQIRRWKIISVLALVLMAGSILGNFVGSSYDSLSFRDYIARIHIDGTIKDDKFDLSRLSDLAENDRIKAVIVHVNSPGGAVVPSEALYDALREIGDVKPVVTVLGSVAASGGYIVALSGDYIVSRRNTITGSIGVLFEWMNFEGFLEIAGVDVNSIKTGVFKGEPNYHSAPGRRVVESLQDVVDDTQDWFRGLVRDRRSLSDSAALGVSDGRIFTGQQALSEGLVDALGGESVAVSWLHEMRGIGEGLEIIDAAILEQDEYGDIMKFFASHILNAFGFPLNSSGFDGGMLRSNLNLDG